MPAALPGSRIREAEGFPHAPGAAFSPKERRQWEEPEESYEPGEWREERDRAHGSVAATGSA
jgi:hypothetical protein